MAMATEATAEALDRRLAAEMDDDWCLHLFEDHSRPGYMSVLERRFPHAWQPALAAGFTWCPRCGCIRKADPARLAAEE